MTIEKGTPSRLKNIIAIIGFILLLLIGIWSAIQVISFIPNLFSDAGVKKETSTDTPQSNIRLGKRDISMTVTPKNVLSGNPITLNWARKGSNEGVVSFSYSCTKDVQFKIYTKIVPCNKPYTLVPSRTSLSLTPISTKPTSTVSVAITYTNAKNNSVRDTKSVTIISLNNTTTRVPANNTVISKKGRALKLAPLHTSGPTEPRATTASFYTAPITKVIRIPRSSNQYGVIDLSVQSLTVGTINAYNVFVPQTILRKYNRGAAQFVIKNLGTKTSGTWYFSAIVPSQGGYSFTSQPQPALLPGASVEVLITFNQLLSGIRPVSIHVDPFNYISESNEYNNIQSRNVSILSL